MDGYHKTDRALLRRLSADTRLSGAEYRVLIAAMLSEKEPGDSVELGNMVTSHDTGLAGRTVERAKKRLLEFGYLQEAGKGSRSATLFRIATTDEMTTGETTGGEMTGSTTDEMTGSRQTRTLFMETGNIGVEPPTTPQKPPSPSKAKPPKKKPVSLTESPTWQQWIAACRAAGRKDPAPSDGALKAAKILTEWVSDPEERRRIMDAYLIIDNDYLRLQGYQLANLTKYYFEGARDLADRIQNEPDDMNDPRAVQMALECVAEEKARIKQQEEKTA